MSKATLVSAVLLSGSLLLAAQQQTPAPRAPPPDIPSTGTQKVSVSTDSNPAMVDPTLHKALAYQARLRAEERRKRMIADTEQLAAISAELKVAVAQMSGQDLPAGVLQKAAQAEKLAKDLQKASKEE